MPDILLGLGAAILKSACQIWLKDEKILSDANSAAIDLMGKRISNDRERRKVNRLFEQMEESIADSLSRSMRHEFPYLSSNEKEAAILAAKNRLQSAWISSGWVLDADLNPLLLERKLRETTAMPHDLSSDALAFHDLVIREACAFVVEAADLLPNFRVGVFAELLQRQTAIVRQLDEVLARVPSQDDEDADFAIIYRRKVVARLDKLEVLGAGLTRTTRRYPLELAYVNLSLEGFAPHHLSSTGQDVSADKALMLTRRLLLRGLAGSGKTTFLRWLSTRWARQDFPGPTMVPRDAIPFFIPLRDFAGRELPQEHEFVRCLDRGLSEEVPTGWVRRQLESGRALILVDGLDELPTNEIGAAHEWLENLVEAYPWTGFVVTSRPSAVESNWLAEEKFQSAIMQSMSLDEIAAFASHWHEAVAENLHDEAELGQLSESEARIVSDIRARRDLSQLASNPLLCALLCALNFERQNQLPTERAELYALAVNMLLERRPVPTPSKEGAPSKANQLALLQDLAYWFLQNEWSSASRDRVVLRLGTRSGSMPIPDPAPGHILTSLLISSGILREPTVTSVDFVHKTFQEYLAARAIVEYDEIGALLTRANEATWREVIVMVAGQARSTQREELLQGLIDKADRLSGLAKAEIELLALGCIAESPEVAPHFRRIVEARALLHIPPSDFTKSEALVPLGKLALEMLRRRPPPDRPRRRRHLFDFYHKLAETRLLV